MHPKLSFEQAPPLSVPFRFFLTAPLFGVLASLLLIWQGVDAMGSRWTPEILALTHLFSAGFMLQAMCGALLQFVPVATGGNVWRPRLFTGIVHPLILIAALTLVTAFLKASPTLFQIAAALFLAGLTPFIVVVGLAVLRTPAQGMTIHALRLALFGLAVTLLLGVFLASVLGGQVRLPLGWTLPVLMNVHAAWGLGGWALLLVIGVSYLVVPMFQLTPSYPPLVSRLLPIGLLVTLLLWSLQLYGANSANTATSLFAMVSFVGLSFAAAFGGVTLWLQKQRRRRVTDASFLFWRGAMLALMALPVSWLALIAFPELGQHPRAMLWLGVLALPGVFVSVINGMLYKIVPFMIWLHLQNLGNLKTLPPNMKQMISERAMQGQMKLHFLAFGLLLAAVLWPPMSLPAGIALLASFLWLEWNLIKALRLYLDFKARTLAGLKDQTPAGAAPRGS